MNILIYFLVAFENGKYFEMSSLTEVKADKLVSKKTADLRMIRYPFPWIMLYLNLGFLTLLMLKMVSVANRKSYTLYYYEECLVLSQQTFTSLKSTMETLEKDVKYVRS